MGTGARQGKIDQRTRVDGREPAIDPVAFLDHQLPDLFRSSGDLLASTAHLDLRPMAVEVKDTTWLLSRTGGDLSVQRGSGDGAGGRWRVDGSSFADVVGDLLTPVALLASGALDLEGCGLGRLQDWWLVLRCVVDGRPVHVPGAIDIPVDLDRSFTMDDDPAELLGFLTDAGFLHLRGVFSAAEMAAVSADMDTAAPSYTDGDGHSWWATLDDGTRQVVRMQGFDERSAATRALVDDDRLARIAAIPGLGHAHPGTSTNRIEALFKPIGVQQGISDVPWHKDCSLGRHSYDCCSLTVGISVTGAGPGTGQLRVVPGSHRALVWPSVLDPATTGLPEVALATDTGDVTVHLSCTLHMAEPPTVSPRRVLYTGFALPPAAPGSAGAARAQIGRVRELAPLVTSQVPARPR